MIVKWERSTRINEYGYEEKYIWREITMRKTGHLWSGSAMETDDSCGNCDGARCGNCRDLYEVFQFGEPKPHIDPDYGWHDYDEQDTLIEKAFFDREEAEEFYDNLTVYSKL